MNAQRRGTHGDAPVRGRRRPLRWRLTPRQLADFEMLTTGGFAPLDGFLGRTDYEAVLEGMRLADGSLWPIPVVLDVPRAAVPPAGGTLLLLDDRGREIGALRVDEAWVPDPEREARRVLGTTDPSHPGVAHLLRDTHPWRVSGKLEAWHRPDHPDLPPLVHSPAEVKQQIGQRGWDRVIAFNSRNPMHEAHRALVLRAAREAGAALLLHPVVGPTRPGDVPAAVRARAHQAVMRRMPRHEVMLALVPLAMRMAGPREALWHALVRRNYGATAFVVGRDHAGPGNDAAGRPFYSPYAAQELVMGHRAELGLDVVLGRELVYTAELGYVARDEVPEGVAVHSISGTRVRQLLAGRQDIPTWLMAPEVVAALRTPTASETWPERGAPLIGAVP